jgi:hypothetical protein
MARLAQDAAEPLDVRIEDENLDGRTEAGEVSEVLSLEVSENLQRLGASRKRPLCGRPWANPHQRVSQPRRSAPRRTAAPSRRGSVRPGSGWRLACGGDGLEWIPEAHAPPHLHTSTKTSVLVLEYKAPRPPSYASVPCWAMVPRTFASREREQVAGGGHNTLIYIPNATHRR